MFLVSDALVGLYFCYTFCVTHSRYRRAVANTLVLRWTRSINDWVYITLYISGTRRIQFSRGPCNGSLKKHSVVAEGGDELNWSSSRTRIPCSERITNKPSRLLLCRAAGATTVSVVDRLFEQTDERSLSYNFVKYTGNFLYIIYYFTLFFFLIFFELEIL